MVIDKIPNDAWERRNILILAKNKLDNSEYDSLHSRDDIVVLTKPFSDEVRKDPIFQNIADSPGSITEDAPLIQNPYSPDIYAPASTSILLDNALTKYMGFVNVCAHLGVKSITIDEKSLERQLDSWSAGLAATIKVGGGDLDLAKAAKAAKEKILKVKGEFYEGQKDIKRARNTAIKHKLISDPSINSLIDCRDMPGGLSSLDLSFSLTNETQRNLKIAASLKIPIYADIKGALEKLSTTESELTITIKMDFYNN